MVAPNPQVRISPSGALAGSSAPDGLAPPLDGMAGAFFQLADDHAAPAGGYSSARIGPVGGASDHVPSAWLYKGIQPVAGAGNRSEFEALDADSDSLEMGIGKWIVEASLTVGFESSAPTGAANGAALACSFQLLNDAGAPVGTADTDTVSIIPSQGSVGLGVVRTTIVRGILEVTQALIDANGGPLTGVQLFMTRQDSDDAGSYGTSSGWLQFSHESTLSIKLYR